MYPKNPLAGKAPAKPQVSVIRVEHLDETGHSFIPPQYEYWVVDGQYPPNVLAICTSYEEALAWIKANGYQPSPT